MKFLEPLFFSKTSTILWCLGFLLFFSVAIFNPGIIALDDYSCIVSQIIPAQKISFSSVIANLGIRNPLAVAVLVGLTKLLFRVGFESPYSQLQIVRIILGCFNFFVFTYFGVQFFRKSSILGIKEWSIGLLGLYFLNPLFFTRPMIEVLSAPFVFLGCFEAFQYWESFRRRHLVLGIFYLMISAMFRFQSGICVLSLIILLILRRDVRGISIAIIASVLFFLLSGLFEYEITGRFHGSLIDYTRYNINHSSSYGVTPFYTFLLLLLGLTIPPTLISRFKKLDWRKEYFDLLPVLLFVGIFVLAHSAVPHKEERFMLPILPLFLIVLTPLLAHFWGEQEQRWRVYWFGIVNGVLLLLTSFNTPQSNTVNLVRYLGENRQIKIVKSVGDTLVLYPTAFVLNSPKLEGLNLDSAGKLEKLDCNTVLVIRKDYEPLWVKTLSDYKKLRDFEPGPLEGLMVKLNPKQNLRRGSVALYGATGCN